ncbi:MAG: LytTR family DNA-binding domain-containing protein [Bacteroidota bacterium]
MKILIIEDEAPAFRRLEKILMEIDPSLEILEVLDSVEDTVKWLRNHSEPDLLLMDIQISDGISFDIFDQIQVTSPVIFTTAFDEYLMKAFKVNSIDYLLKPVKKEALATAIEKLQTLKSSFGNANATTENLNELLKQIDLTERKYKSRFLVKQGEKLLAIKVTDIVCFYSKHSIVHIVTKGGKKYLSDFTLDDLGQQVDPLQFFRANRQFIVGAEYIKVVHKYVKGKLLVELEGYTEDQIVVSTEKATSFKNWLDQ